MTVEPISIRYHADTILQLDIHNGFSGFKWIGYCRPINRHQGLALIGRLVTGDHVDFFALFLRQIDDDGGHPHSHCTGGLPCSPPPGDILRTCYETCQAGRFWFGIRDGTLARTIRTTCSFSALYSANLAQLGATYQNDRRGPDV